MDELTIEKTVRFEAAHHLPHMPVGHKCRNVHGHSYVLTVAVRGPIDPSSGIVLDFAELQTRMRRLTDRWDHSPLNDWIPNPTGENLVLAVVHHMGVELTDSTARLVRVRLEEGANNATEWP